MTSGEPVFEVVGGSVPGRAHLRAGRNNQDSFAWRQQDGCLAAVVSDGCGAAPHSEVGAQLAARLLVEVLLRDLPAAEGTGLLERACLELCAALAALARSLGGPLPLSRIVADYFLFTLVGVAIGPEQAFLFALGDGVAAFNGEEIVLGPFPNNEPPYLGYALLEGGKAGPLQLLAAAPVQALRSVLLGSDGVLDLRAAAARSLPGRSELVGPLSQFWKDDFYYRNPDGVRRRLAMTNRPAAGGGLLPDDTTLIALRRRPPDLEVTP